MAKVSVIIPTYNRANFIGTALDSVISQTYQDAEIIVVDEVIKDTDG
jgi:glycosyltransferase involved in cell wall biosynthesis